MAKELNSIENDQYTLLVFECQCGYHMGIDATYVEQVRDVTTKCPSCDTIITTLEE
jgi:hypothetical protein